jgi:dihydropteroate synthase
VIPRLRIVSPSPAQLAADANAPFVLFASVDVEGLVLATSSVGLGIELAGGIARIVASKPQLRQLGGELHERGISLAIDVARFLDPQAAWQLRTMALPLDRPHIMGILNLTDDSFSGDGVGHEMDAALRRAERLREAGANIIDVGAETARADRPVVEEAVEAALIAPVVRKLAAEGHCVSIDTYKRAVARAALESGAEIVNDISGLTLGTAAAEEAAAAKAGYVLNYSYSVPKRRPDSPPHYEDVVAETVWWMGERLDILDAAGLDRAHIAIDPGIAFGKSHDEDIQVLRRLGELRTYGQPVLIAHSRKNYIGSINGQPPAERDLETYVSAALAYEQGARLFRVHEPAGARRALEMVSALVSAPAGAFAPDAESWPWRAGASATHMTREAPDRPAPHGQRW